MRRGRDKSPRQEPCCSSSPLRPSPRLLASHAHPASSRVTLRADSSPDKPSLRCPALCADDQCNAVDPIYFDDFETGLARFPITFQRSNWDPDDVEGFTDCNTSPDAKWCASRLGLVHMACRATTEATRSQCNCSHLLTPSQLGHAGLCALRVCSDGCGDLTSV